MTALIKTKHSNLDDITEEILRRYLTMKQGRTQVEYQRNLKKFFDWLYLRDDQQIRPDTIQEYKIHLESKDLKTSSINAYLAPIKDFFKWCFNMDYMPMDVGKYVSMSKKKDQGTTQARALTDDEVMSLLLSTSKDSVRLHSERMMLLMLFNLGMRISEILGLRMQDIDLKQGIVRINGKGSKVRVLGISDHLKDELVEYLEVFKEPLGPYDYLIQTVRKGRNTKPGSAQHGNKVLKRTAERAGIDMTDVRSHSGRVTAINHLLDKEVSMRDVANFAGHTSVDTTRRYDRKDQDRVIQTCNIIKFR